MMPDHISVLPPGLPGLPGLDVLPDDEVVQLHLLLHQGRVGGWPVTDCGGQESPGTSSSQNSPRPSPRHRGGEPGLGEERDGEVEGGEGGETSVRIRQSDSH